MRKIIPTMMILTALVLAGCSQTTNTELPQGQEDKLVVVTTLFPLYEFANEIGGDKVDVTLLLPPGGEPHSFEPKPSDIVKIQNADSFIYIGEIMEPWAHDILDGIDNSNLNVIDASSLVTLLKSGETEEHDHDSEEHTFEWIGVFELEPGIYKWSFSKVEGEYADSTMKMVIIQSDDIESVESEAESMIESDSLDNKYGADQLIPNAAYLLNFDETEAVTSFTITITEAGDYAFFTEHMPTEFESGEHFLKDADGNDIEPIMTEPESEEGHHHGEYDPHIWLDLGNDEIIVKEIAKRFSSLDPDNAQYYAENANKYNQELDGLDIKYSSELQNCEKSEFLVGGHNFFGYIENRYGVKGISAIENLEPNTEPTPKKIQEIADVAKEHNIKYILTEVLVNKAMSEAIATEVGAEVLTFNPGANLPKSDFDAGVTFLSVMEDNLQTLKTALECN